MYWGHCDIDVILGDLSSFLDPLLNKDYDKLFCLGHMTIYRNSNSNNRVFMSQYNGSYLYKKVYSNPMICWFDEEYQNKNNINQIFVSLGKKIMEHDMSLNISQKNIRFHRTRYIGSEKAPSTHGFIIEPYSPFLYVWDNGELIRYFVSNNKLIAEMFPYIHLQGRKMDINIEFKSTRRYKIVPNSFSPLSDEINLSNWENITKGDDIFNLIGLYINKLINRICNKTHKVLCPKLV